MIKVVVLISGSGTNLQALIDAIDKGTLPATITAVISNKADAYGLVRARQAGIEHAVIDHREFPSRAAFDQVLQDKIDQYQPDLVVLAGFMRILTAEFTRHYLGRMLNIHPSLLPKYPGLDTHQRALDAGDPIHGATVHFVTPELDDGPNIIQAVVPIEPDDTTDTLSQRVQQQEYIIYPMAVHWFAQGRLIMENNSGLLANSPLPATGFIVDSRNL